MKILVVLLLSLFCSQGFAAVDGTHWYPWIGDPTIFGWVTVICYFVAAHLSYKEYKHVKYNHLLGEPKFWLGLAIVLLLLGFNKQLDLQTVFTYLVRQLSIQQGWYEDRRTYQVLFIVGLALSLLGFVYALRLFLARCWHLYKVTWVGIILLCFFVLVRAASFHHFDNLIGEEFLGLRLNVMMEIGALMMIIYGIYAHKKTPKIKLKPYAKDYVEVTDLSARIGCPRCNYPPSASLAYGRTFKCKRCAFKYTIFESSPV